MIRFPFISREAKYYTSGLLGHAQWHNIDHTFTLSGILSSRFMVLTEYDNLKSDLPISSR